ncbi:TIR domain-containing protein [Protofrankia sp. BMG5.30]|uniref:TIR domain-containing protein n=1 Tax=Protofrankia sp. BMG5.30 TaxID=1834514 RepID=UPI001588CCE7|nr:TIR domain-containing protein [Protofrankia sp. BMG5.30]
MTEQQIRPNLHASAEKHLGSGPTAEHLDQEPAPRWDFFISYASADEPWAEWVAWQLEATGLRVMLRAWYFVPGANWIDLMRQGVSKSDRVIVLLSHAYLNSIYNQTEWRVVWAADPSGEKRKLVPLRIEGCEPPELLHQLVSVDLFDVDQHTARKLLLPVAHDKREKPVTEPPFPGNNKREKPVTEPPFPSGPITLPPQTRDKLESPAPGPADPPEPPNSISGSPGRWIRRRRVQVAFVLVLALLAGAVVWLILRPTGDPACRSQGTEVSLSWIDGECVGYSARDFKFGEGGDRDTDPPSLSEVQEKIFAQNSCAEKLRDISNQRRPFVTLIYFSALTRPREAGRDWAKGSVAELTGMLTWQRHLNVIREDKGACEPNDRRERSDDLPILRVVVANGGSEMKYASEVVKRQIIPFATRRENGVLGVIGMDRSTAATEQAIRELGRKKIPVIATSLTGDGMKEFSPLYFQMAPENERQALLVAMYAIKNKKNRVSVYYPRKSGDNTADAMPDIDNRYLYTLVRDLRNEIGKTSARSVDNRSLTLDLRGWNSELTDRELQAWLRSECAKQNTDDLIFYAGWGDDFGDFLDGMENCLDKEKEGLFVLGDDSVSYYVTGNAGKDDGNVTFRYVSMGAPVALARESCSFGTLDSYYQQGKAPLASSNALREFCTRLNDMYEKTGVERPGTLWPDENIGLSYDAVKVFVDAVHTTHGEIDIDKIVRAVSQEPREGATGTRDFRVSQTSTDRQLTIIRVNRQDHDIPRPGPPGESRIDAEENDSEPCKFAIVGIQPRTVDCYGNPVEPLGG